MSNYRLKIAELNNGHFYYVPQVYKITENDNSWYNIYNVPNEKTIFEHFVNFVDYNSQKEALEIIDKHKKQVEWLKSFEIKKITYKEIL